MNGDDATTLELRRLWAEGHSTAAIGRRMGLSKNAIVGRAHRLDLDGRPSPIQRDGYVPVPLKLRPLPPASSTLPPLASAAVQVDAPPSPIAAKLWPPAPLTGPTPVQSVVTAPTPSKPRRNAPSCCWPIGEPGTKAFRFCDDVAALGKPYCDEHARLAHVRVRDRREDAA
jgi:GcrA cell cycle regulator